MDCVSLCAAKHRAKDRVSLRYVRVGQEPLLTMANGVESGHGSRWGIANELKSPNVLRKRLHDEFEDQDLILVGLACDFDVRSTSPARSFAPQSGCGEP